MVKFAFIERFFLFFSDNTPTQYMEQENSPREFTPEMKLFVVMEKEKGSSYPMLVDEFSKRWPGKKPPSRVGVLKMRKSLQ